jgi:hypothetical protein
LYPNVKIKGASVAGSSSGGWGKESGKAPSAVLSQASQRIRQINPNAAKASTTSGITGVKELGSMAVAYAKQETVAPLKGLARYAAFGLAAAVCFSTGLFLLALGALRAIQAATGAIDAERGGFDGSLTWLPYLLAVLVCVLLLGIIGFAAVRATKSATKSVSR